MSDLEQRLRDELPGLVPLPPAAPDRAAGARAFAARARRRTALAVAATVVVAAGAIATPLLLSGGGGPELAPVSPAVDLECPARVADVGGNGPLGEDPVAARLCSWTGTADSMVIQAPADALVEGVDDLARSINALPLTTDDTSQEPACGSRIGPGFVLVLAYADGSERALIGSDYGCPQLTVVGGPTHTRPSEALSAFTQALHVQRSHTTPPDLAAPAPECGAWPLVPPSAGTTVSLATIDEVDRAIVCIQPHRRNLTPQGTLRRADVTADELGRLRAAWAPDGSARTDCTASGAAWVVGSTPWGETLRADLCRNLERSADSDALLGELDARAVPEQ